MKLSKKQKVFLYLLAVAIAALLVDRVFLSSGAVGAEEALAMPEVTPDAPARPDLPAQEEQPLAERLRTLSETQSLDVSRVRDAFCLAPAWSAELRPPAVPVPQVDQTLKLMQNHRLMAVMVGPDGGYAVVDGKRLLVGQERDGIKLVSVNENSAILESGGIRFQLKLDTGNEAEEEP